MELILKLATLFKLKPSYAAANSALINNTCPKFESFLRDFAWIEFKDITVMRPYSVACASYNDIDRTFEYIGVNLSRLKPDQFTTVILHEIGHRVDLGSILDENWRFENRVATEKRAWELALKWAKQYDLPFDAVTAKDAYDSYKTFFDWNNPFVVHPWIPYPELDALAEAQLKAQRKAA